MNIRKAFVLFGSLLLLLSGIFMPAAQALEDVRFELRTSVWQFAQEVFGDRASDVALGTNLARTVTLTVLGDSGVSVAAAGTIEYRLTQGVQFGRDLTDTSLVFDDADNGGANDRVTIMLQRGTGRAGDSSATFQVRVTGDNIEDNNIEVDDTLVLTIPGIQNLPQGLTETVLVQVYIEATTGSGGGNFQDLSPLEDEVKGNMFGTNAPDLVRPFDVVLLVADSLAESATATIDVSMREQFADNAVSITRTGTTGLSGAEIGLVVYNSPAGFELFQGADGSAFAFDMDDMFRVSVAGNLHENAFFFIDLDGDKTVDDSELIPEAGLSFPVLGTDGARLLNEDQRDEIMNEGPSVYFVTDGETELVAGDFTVTLALDFADATYLDEQVSVTTSLGFEGLMQDGFAYAIPNCTQTDRARIRVTNETNNPLTLFVQGVDQAGTDMGFVEVDARQVRAGGGESASLMEGETLVLFSRHVEQVFGFNDGQYDKDTRCTAAETWSGRAQLSFYASGNITVTPLIRGTDGQLRDLGGFTGLTVGMDGKVIGR